MENATQISLVALGPLIAFIIGWRYWNWINARPQPRLSYQSSEGSEKPSTTRDRVEDPSQADWEWLRGAEQHILHCLQTRYGDVALTHAEADLELAQRFVDDNVFSSDDVY